jgi:hypothetical protein
MSQVERVPEPDSASGEARSAPRSLVQPLIAALLLSLVCLPLPYISLENDADSSLILLLDYARQHNLQFGIDFVNTYGPLGFLIFPCYSGDAAGARLVADVLIAFATTAGLCLLAWRQSLVWRALLLALFLWSTANIRVGPDLLLNVMLLSWGFLCFLEDQPRLPWCALIAAALGGFCAVAKISFLVVGTGGVFLIALDLWLRGRRDLALGMPAVFAGVFLAGWCGMSQELGNLPAFLLNALATIRGYNAALGIDVRASLRHTGTALVILAILLVALRSALAFAGKSPKARWRKVLLFAWAASLTFAAWKHGFVRMDSYHVAMFLGFIPILLLSLETLTENARTSLVWLRGAGLVCGFGALAALQFYCLDPMPDSLVAPWKSGRLNLGRLLHPSDFRRRADLRLDSQREQAQLPKLRDLVGTSTIDVFGFRQSYALYNGMNFRPRPVSQSYAACNADLMRINQRFLQSGKGTDFFLFEMNPLDSKFPALEDAMVLRDLILNFDPVAQEDRFVLLRRTSQGGSRLRLLREATVKPGEPIDLRAYGNTNLWIEIDLAPSLLGWLRQFASQPPVLRLAAWKAPGGELIYRRQARASMLASGFVASPLLRWTSDALNLQKSAPRPGAYTLELNGQDRFWKCSAQVRVFEIERGEATTTDLDSSAARGNATSRPFTIFRNQRWRPDLPPPGGVNEIIAYGFILLLPAAGVAALICFAKRLRRTGRPPTTLNLLVGNVLVFGTLAGLTCATAETYFRFFYDTTDSLGSTRVSERWVQRHWHINAAGVRDDIEYSPGLDDGKRRLSFVGDSFTAGHGIKQVDDRFPNLLRQAHPDWQIHVLANVGLDTGAEIVLVNKLAAKGYAFDRVVLVYCLNDIGDLVSRQGEAFTRMFDGMGPGNWLTRNSYALNLFTQRYHAGRNPYVRNYFSFVREAYQGEIWERQKARLREFRAAVESRGGRLTVVTFPFLDALGPDYAYKTVHEELDRFWREQGVPHLDLLPLYSNLSPRELVVNAHDAHPNERANRLAAETLESFLFPASAKPQK